MIPARVEIAVEKVDFTEDQEKEFEINENIVVNESHIIVSAIACDVFLQHGVHLIVVVHVVMVYKYSVYLWFQ